MKKIWNTYAGLILPVGIILLFDQVTKAWVRSNLAPGQVLRSDLWLSQIIRIIHASNTGVAIGMLDNLGDVPLLLQLLISLGVLFYYSRLRQEGQFIRISLGILLGGALGNVLDRILQDGRVTDFISIWRLPVFNLADLFVLIGAITVAIAIEQREAQPPQARPGYSR